MPHLCIASLYLLMNIVPLAAAIIPCRSMYVEQHALGVYMMEYHTPSALATAQSSASVAAAATPAATKSAGGVPSGIQHCNHGDERVKGLLTFAWPLLPATNRASEDHKEKADYVVVALPQGTTSTWEFSQQLADQAEARLTGSAAPAEAAAARCGSSSGAAGSSAKGKGSRQRSGKQQKQEQSCSGRGPSREVLEVPYANLWQYRDTGVTRHQHFMATSWAALWPVFVGAAVRRSSELNEEVRGLGGWGRGRGSDGTWHSVEMAMVVSAGGGGYGGAEL